MEKNNTNIEKNQPTKEQQDTIPISLDSDTSQHKMPPFMVFRKFIVLFKNFMKREDASQWCIFALTIAITIFTAIGIFFTKKQISIYEQTTKFDLRAYIAMKDISIASPNIGSYPNGLFRYENIGKTPAYNCRHCITILVDTIDITRNEIEKLIKEPVKGLTVGANMPIRMQVPSKIAFNDSICTNIKNGKLKFYIFGSIFYDDIFKEKHFAHFCGLYLPTNGDTNIRPEYSDAN